MGVLHFLYLYVLVVFKSAGIHMQWGIAVGIYVNIGTQLIAHLVSKAALSGSGLTRFRILYTVKKHGKVSN